MIISYVMVTSRSKTRSAANTRQRILDYAADALARKGWRDWGVNRLAKDASVAKPLIYRYLDGLQGVEATLLEDPAFKGLFDPLDREGPAGNTRLKQLLDRGRKMTGSPASRAMLSGLLAGTLSANAGPENLSKFRGSDSSGPAWSGGEDPAAVNAVLAAAVAFLVLARQRLPGWCGVPLGSADDMARLEFALQHIIKCVDASSGDGGGNSDG